MRASRLLSILLILQSRGRMTAPALAREFEVSIRTIYRDMEDLSAAGVPVYTDRGPAGGFQLLDGYRTWLTGLTSAEAEALFLFGLRGPAADLGMGDAVIAAHHKLIAALPEERRQGAERVASCFHLDPVAWYRKAERSDVLPALAEAVWNAMRVRIRYESWTNVVDRELDALGLVLKAGVWYFVASADGQPRTYRVSAIQTFELTAEKFSRPESFVLSAYWTAWTDSFESRLYRGKAILKVSPKGFERLSLLASAVGEMAARTAGVPDEEGRFLVTIPIESIDHAAAEILTLGVEAEVAEPLELRRKLAEMVSQLGAIYSNNARPVSQQYSRLD